MRDELMRDVARQTKPNQLSSLSESVCRLLQIYSDDTRHRHNTLVFLSHRLLPDRLAPPRLSPSLSSNWPDLLTQPTRHISRTKHHPRLSRLGKEHFHGKPLTRRPPTGGECLATCQTIFQRQSCRHPKIIYSLSYIVSRRARLRPHSRQAVQYLASLH